MYTYVYKIISELINLKFKMNDGIEDYNGCWRTGSLVWIKAKCLCKVSYVYVDISVETANTTRNIFDSG